MEVFTPELLAGYVALNALTFVTYAADKSAAAQGRWRTSEATLHLLAVLGGWPAAFAAQHVFRHKTRKQPFRTVFWMTVAGNVVLLAWLASPGG